MTRFLLVTDLHYCKKEVSGDRFHAQSLEKLRKALKESAADCDFIVNLGDTAENREGYGNQLELLSELSAEFKKTGKPYFTAIGNHDTASDKHEWFKMTDMPGRYYSFDAGEYLGVVLDAAMNSKEEPFPQGEMVWTEPYIDDEQLIWFKELVEKSEKNILLFTHFPIMIPDFHADVGTKRNHCVINRDELFAIIDDNPKIRGMFSGHYHDGGIMTNNGKPYLIFRAMCVENECTYAVVSVNDDMLTVEGHGMQESYRLGKVE